MDPPRREPPLSIIIINWNRGQELRRCLDSVLRHTTYQPLEVLVVDNGSSDGSPDMIRREFPSVRLLTNQRNLGAGTARNQGMAAAQGELFVLMDCDTYVEDDVISRAARALIERSEAGMLSCETCYPGGRRQHSAHRAMSIRLSLLQNLWLYKLLPKERQAETLLGGFWEEDREITVDWLTGAFVVLRRRLFTESGGFNPDLFPEDSEWGIRLSRAGHRIVYAPQIGVVYHTGSVSNLASDTEQLRLYHRAGIEAYRTLNGALLGGLYRLAQLVGVATRWLAYRVATTLRPDPYFESQRAYYRKLVDVYLRPSGPA